VQLTVSAARKAHHAPAAAQRSQGCHPAGRRALPQHRKGPTLHSEWFVDLLKYEQEKENTLST